MIDALEELVDNLSTQIAEVEAAGGSVQIDNPPLAPETYRVRSVNSVMEVGYGLTILEAKQLRADALDWLSEAVVCGIA